MSLLLDMFGVKWRELQLPDQIVGTTWPSAAPGGHKITLAGGAARKTTSGGVKFTGTATSNMVIAANAGQNAKAAFHITIRWTPKTTFTVGSTSGYLFNKQLAADDYIRIYMDGADGKLYWFQGNAAGGTQFILTSTTTVWTAGTAYIITASLDDTPAQRLIVNGVAEDTDNQAARSTPNGGDITIASSSDGATDGISGTISWVVIGVGATATVGLTAAEEQDLSKGIPPPTAKIQHMYLMDEGEGAVTNDMGSLGVNGVLDSACTWDKTPPFKSCLSLDGIDAYGQSDAGLDINGDMTVVLVEKLKSTYNSTTLTRRLLTLTATDFNNRLGFFSVGAHEPIGLFIKANGGADYWIDYTTPVTIDNYAILTASVVAGVSVSYYVNGILIGTIAVTDMLIPASARMVLSIDADDLTSHADVSKVLLPGIIDGALTGSQVLQLSRTLNNELDLGLAI